MMDSTTLCLELDRIGEISGKKDKEAAVAELLEDSFASDVLKLMYDGRITFGIAEKTLKPLDHLEFGDESFDSVIPRQVTEARLAMVSEEVANTLHHLRMRELTGNEAREDLERLWQLLDAPSRELVRRILLGDARAGFTQNTINRAQPGAIFTFDCMLAHKFEPKRIKDWGRVVAEPKLDGMRALAVTDRATDSVTFYTRSGKEIPTMAHRGRALLDLLDDAQVYDDAVIDCELLSPTNSFNETISSARKGEGDSDVVTHCFDILPLPVFRGEGKSGVYEDRRKELERVVGVPAKHEAFQVVPRYFVQSEAEVATLYERVRERGLEGLIVKPLDHRYQRKRSRDWMKIKAEETADLVITDVYEGEYGTKNEGKLGGVKVDFNGVEVSVGGGWSDDDRRVIWANPDVALGRMIEVLYHEVTPDGSLRHPRFVRWRDDKQEQQAA